MEWGVCGGAGTQMAQLQCGGCHQLLMYTRGATSVQCSQCHTVNLVMQPNQMAHINCQGCGVTLACVPVRCSFLVAGASGSACLCMSAWQPHCRCSLASDASLPRAMGV